MIEKLSDEYSSQNLLFKMWKYGLILPEFTYNKSEKVFKHKMSYVRFFNCTILLILNYLILVSENGQDSKVFIFVTTVYNFLLIFTTWFTTIVIYLAVGTIEKMSENTKTIIQLKKFLDIDGYTKNRRIDFSWLIYLGILYFIMFVADVSLYFMDVHFNVNLILFIHIFYILDIEFQQLLICFKSSVVIHFQQLNQCLENGKYNPEYIKYYQKMMDETEMATSDFISVSSYMIIVKYLYVAYSIVLSLFIGMEFAEMNSNLTFALSCITNSIWFSIEVSMILLVVHQDDSICVEVGFPLFRLLI